MKQRKWAAVEKLAILMEGLKGKRSVAVSHGAEDYLALCREIKERE